MRRPRHAPRAVPVAQAAPLRQQPRRGREVTAVHAGGTHPRGARRDPDTARGRCSAPRRAGSAGVVPRSAPGLSAHPPLLARGEKGESESTAGVGVRPSLHPRAPAAQQRSAPRFPGTLPAFSAVRRAPRSPVPPAHGPRSLPSPEHGPPFSQCSRFMIPSFLSAQPPLSTFPVLPERSSPSIQCSRFPTPVARSAGPVPAAPTLSGRCSGSGFPALGSFISPGSPTVSPWGSAPLAPGFPASRCLPGARRLPRRGSPVSFLPQPRFLGVSPSSLQPGSPGPASSILPAVPTLLSPVPRSVLGALPRFLGISPVSRPRFPVPAGARPRLPPAGSLFWQRRGRGARSGGGSRARAGRRRTKGRGAASAAGGRGGPGRDRGDRGGAPGRAPGEETRAGNKTCAFP